MAVGRAQPDDVDAHAAVSRHLRSLDRVDSRGAAPVAQQDDGGRTIGAWRHGRDRLGRLGLGVQAARRRAAPGAVGHLAQVDAVIREELGQAHDDGAAQGRAALHLDGIDRGHERRAFARRALRHLGRAGKGHQPHVDAPGHLGQESLGRLLGRRHAGGFHIRHAHAQRHVQGQQDRGARTGQRDGRDRAGQRQQQRRQCEQHQGRRHVAPPGPASRCAHHLQARQPHRLEGAPAQQPQVQRHQRRQRQHPPQVQRPQELHRLHRLGPCARRAQGHRAQGLGPDAGIVGHRGMPRWEGKSMGWPTAQGPISQSASPART